VLEENVSKVNRAARRAQSREAMRGGRRARQIAALGSGAVLAASAGGAALALGATSAHATVSDTVTTLADSGPGSLRAAILDANSGGGGTITFQSGLTGTILLASSLPSITAPLTITGPGASAVAIDGASSFRVFYLTTPDTVTVSGLTLQHSDSAPLAVKAGGTLLADSVAVVNNAATNERGGGFYCVGTSGTLSNFTLTNSTVTGNSTPDGGGGGYAGDCNVTIVSSSIANNQALGDSDGGGLYFRHLGARSIENTTISGNDAADNSGGVYVYQGGPTTISNSTIADNSAVTDAGGISLNGGAPLTLVQSTITGNTVTAPARSSSAGGLYLLGGTAVAGASSSNTANASDVNASSAGEVSIVGTILWGNSDPSDQNSFDIASGGTAGTVSSDHSLLGTHEPVITVTDLGGTLTGVDPMLGALANNGGPTETFALLVGSPAIDKGPNPLPSYPLNGNDQRGSGYPRVTNGAVDIGAFEVQPPPTPAPEVVIQPAFTG
jgi:parallel beta-helix repeat protein